MAPPKSLFQVALLAAVAIMMPFGMIAVLLYYRECRRRRRRGAEGEPQLGDSDIGASEDA